MNNDPVIGCDGCSTTLGRSGCVKHNYGWMPKSQIKMMTRSATINSIVAEGELAVMTAERDAAIKRAEKAEDERGLLEYAVKCHEKSLLDFDEYLQQVGAIQRILAAQNAELRKALESAVERMDRDESDEESVDTCLNCGDGARDRINSEDWKFDSHGDMLCRDCGAHRGLCGYKVNGLDDVKETMKAALSIPAPAAVANCKARWQAEALRTAAKKIAPSETGGIGPLYYAGLHAAVNYLEADAQDLEAEAINGTTTNP